MIMIAVAIALVAKSASAQMADDDFSPPPPTPTKAQLANLPDGMVGFPLEILSTPRGYNKAPSKATLQGKLQDAKAEAAYLRGKQEGEERLNSHLHGSLLGFAGALFLTLVVFFSLLISFVTRQGHFGPVNEPKCDEAEDS